MTTRYQIQISTREWAGSLTNGRWVPAIDGTYNQTSKSAEEASTFDTREEAEGEAEELREYLRDEDERNGDGDPEWSVRVEEVEIDDATEDHRADVDALAEFAGIELRLRRDEDAPPQWRWAVWGWSPDVETEDKSQIVGSGENPTAAIDGARRQIQEWRDAGTTGAAVDHAESERQRDADIRAEDARTERPAGEWPEHDPADDEDPGVEGRA